MISTTNGEVKGLKQELEEELKEIVRTVKSLDTIHPKQAKQLLSKADGLILMLRELQTFDEFIIDVKINTLKGLRQNYYAGLQAVREESSRFCKAPPEPR